MKITSLPSLRALLLFLHETYSIPHIIITSFNLPPSPTNPALPSPPFPYLDRLATSPSSLPVESYPTLTSVASSYTPSSSSPLNTTLFSTQTIYSSSGSNSWPSRTNISLQPFPASNRVCFSTTVTFFNQPVCFLTKQEDFPSETEELTRVGEDGKM